MPVIRRKLAHEAWNLLVLPIAAVCYSFVFFLSRRVHNAHVRVVSMPIDRSHSRTRYGKSTKRGDAKEITQARRKKCPITFTRWRFKQLAYVAQPKTSSFAWLISNLLNLLLRREIPRTIESSRVSQHTQLAFCGPVNSECRKVQRTGARTGRLICQHKPQRAFVYEARDARELRMRAARRWLGRVICCDYVQRVCARGIRSSRFKLTCTFMCVAERENTREWGTKSTQYPHVRDARIVFFRDNVYDERSVCERLRGERLPRRALFPMEAKFA